jgi:RNA polymerase sigma factor (sigma-70 family)
MELNALAEAPAARIRAVDPDAELVARARANPREFLGLYDRYFDRVLGYTRVRVADAATCEDVTSRVFTTALEQLGRFRAEGSFAGWLFQIARNTVRDVHRRRPTEPLVDERPAPDPTPEEHVMRVRMHRILEELRRRYPHDDV